MTFEEKIIKNCKLRQRKLMRAAQIAHEKPDTGVTILKKGAYFLIKDAADITVKYLAHLSYSSYANPIGELKGKFTQAEIIDFVGRAKEEAQTRQLLNIVMTDIGSAQIHAIIGKSEPIPVVVDSPIVPEHDYSITDDEDVYGDYDLDDDSSNAPEPIVREDNDIVDVDDATGVINKLIETFKAK
tara:strand:+ start:3011 stop:3565 length:555 start_codon:yes stop_codon:yes gene_type:complete